MWGITKQGFTVLELLVAMAIVAILLAAGVPSFKNYSWNLRMRTAMDSLRTDLVLARRHAISLNVDTVVCPGTGDNTCSDKANWQNGWIVFTDLNGDHLRQPTEPLLSQASAVDFVTISSTRARRYIRFNPSGFAPGSNLTFLFCDPRGARYAGRVTVSNSGRIRQQTGGGKPTSNCP